MADQDVQIEMVQGEDFAAQIFWTSEYNDPIPIADPVLMDVKDGVGQIALRFDSSTDPTLAAHLSYNSQIGFFQLTAPAAATRLLIPGRYLFDLWAAVADSASPFDRQARLVFGGSLVVGSRTTKLELAPNILDAQVEAP